MYSFPDLIKKIREEAGLTQAEFAKALNVSTILISMVETEQKEVSKKLLISLANKLRVHPASITPFLFNIDKHPEDKISYIEKTLIDWGEKMQVHLIKERSKLLKEDAK